MQDKKFFVVANFGSSHWKMRDAKISVKFEDAERDAKTLAEKYKDHEYYILEAVAVVRQPKPPTEVVKLTELMADPLPTPTTVVDDSDDEADDDDEGYF